MERGDSCQCRGDALTLDVDVALSGRSVDGNVSDGGSVTGTFTHHVVRQCRVPAGTLLPASHTTQHSLTLTISFTLDIIY